MVTPDTHIINKEVTNNPITITIPDGSTMTSTHTGHIAIPNLPPDATIAHVVPELETHSLLSLGQLCDAGCTATVTKSKIDIKYDDTTVISGDRSAATSLWHLDYPQSVDTTNIFPIYANAAINTNNTEKIVAFIHAALYSPALSTLQKALKLGYISNIPGFTEATLKKFPPLSAPMIKGHLDQTRKNLRSTKVDKDDDDKEDDDDIFPLTLQVGDDANNFCYSTVFEPTGTVYSDQTGYMVQPSSKGNNLLVIMYDYDSNAILAEPIRNRKANTILDAIKKLHSQLRNKGIRPRTHIVDNECSDIMKQYLNDNNIKYQLAAPGQHRINAAERAIRTFKNHFIAGLCSLDANFPIQLWDRLLPQALLSINLLRGSRLNPKHSAWSQLHGPYDFNKTPIAPPGIRVLVHEKPDKRKTWAPHAVDAWYIGPADEHYRCYKVFIWETQAERVTDTLTWFPTQVQLPTASSTDIIVAALQEVTTELQNPTLPNSIIGLTDTNITTLKNITNTLTNILSDKSDDIDTSNNSTNDITNDPTPPQRVSDALEDTAPQRVIETIKPKPEPEPSTNKPTKSVAFDTIPYPHRPTYKNPKPDRVDIAAANNSDKWPIPRTIQRKHDHFTRSNAVAASVIENSKHFVGYGNAINPDTGLPAEYMELSVCTDGPLWKGSMSGEIGRLAKGNGKDVLTGTDTIRFIHFHEIPPGAKITYTRIVVADRPEKSNPRRVRVTIGGNLVVYLGTTSTKAAEVPTVKIFINSIISSKGAKFLTLDIKDFFLQTARMPAKDYAYMRMPVKVIPEDIMEYYQLYDKVHDDHVYIEVSKGMYGLPQAGRLANDQLRNHLAPFGYRPCPITAGLWKHDTRDISFLLVVDDFGVKYTDKRDVEHLINALQTAYKLSIDWEGERYCGLILKWDYTKRTCDVSMPGYIARALQRFEHPTPKRPQHNPFKYIPPDYGAKIQYENSDDTSPLLDKKLKTRVQEILGTLLYYARAVDPTMLVTISSLSTQQANPTENTLKAINHLLDYCATHPNAVTRYHASDMILHVESDASYLSEAKAKSRFAGYHYLSDDPKGENILYPPINGPVLVAANIIKETVSSASEAETAGLFHNAQEACPLRHALIEMGHPQPATPMQTDNSTAAGLANDTIKQKRSKAMNMRWFWIRDKIEDNTFNVYWNKGATNRADYFSKQHPTKHHIEMRSTYLHCPEEDNINDVTDLATDDEIFVDTVDGYAYFSSTSNECGKGVLIPYREPLPLEQTYSGSFPLDTISWDPHSYVPCSMEQGEPGSDNDRCPTQFSQLIPHRIVS